MLETSEGGGLTMRAIRVVSMLAVTLAIVALTVTMCGTGPSQAATSIQNLRAFAKLYGYVRWFHPSDEAAALDWDAFAIFGAERVKEAETPEDLRRLLEELFEPVAPTVQIFPASVPAPPLSVELVPVDADSLHLVA
jgi:hypothetical protein